MIARALTANDREPRPASAGPRSAPRGQTKGAILDALKRADGLTTNQLARRLGITAMAVRKHLTALERDGLVTSSLIKRPVGRPAHLYRLAAGSDDLFPKRYDAIVVEFLADLAQLDGPAKVDLLFNRRAERTYDYLAARLAGATTFDERVARLAEGMDELGYLTSWEKLAEGEYQVSQFNCAIQRVASTFPQACHYELETYRRLLDADISRACHLLAGDHLCCYIIRRRPIDNT